MDKASTQIDVSIVFTNWNTCEFLRNCLHSVYEKTQGLTYEIIVVDDGSTDRTVEMLREEFPEVSVIVNEKNLGVAKAYNRGVAHALGRYVQMLNTDMILIGNAIKVLFDFLEMHPDAGACCGWLRNPDMSSQVSFGHYPSFPQAVVDALFLNDLFPHAHLPNRGVVPDDSIAIPLEVEYIGGASMMIRKSVIEQHGFFDEYFTSYCEETDFCYRMRHNAGLKLYFVPGAQIIHFGGASFGKVKKYQIQLQYSGYDKFLSKHHGRLYSFCTRLLYAWHFSIKMIFRLAVFLLAPPDRKDEKKNHFLNAWYVVRYSIVPNEQFTGK